MAFEGLTEKISSAFKHLRSKGRLTESDIKEAMREIRMALLEADVNFKVAKDFIKAVTERRPTPRSSKACPRPSRSSRSSTKSWLPCSAARPPV